MTLGLALGRSLELATGAELHAVAGLDLDALAGLRVATRACGAVGALDSDPTRDGDLGALADRLGKNRESTTVLTAAWLWPDSAATAATNSVRFSDLSAMGVLLGRRALIEWSLCTACKRPEIYQLDLVIPGNSPR